MKVPSTPDIEYLPELLQNVSLTHTEQELRLLNQLLQPQAQAAQTNSGGSSRTADVVTKASSSSSSSRLTPVVTAVNSINSNAKTVITVVNTAKSMTASTPKAMSRAVNIRSTPESSQTDSDDFSPQTARKRKGVCARDILPRFSISIEDDNFSGGSSSAENTREQSPLAVQHHKPLDGNHATVVRNQSRSTIIKSASALGLSLVSITSGTFKK